MYFTIISNCRWLIQDGNNNTMIVWTKKIKQKYLTNSSALTALDEIIESYKTVDIILNLFIIIKNKTYNT